MEEALTLKWAFKEAVILKASKSRSKKTGFAFQLQGGREGKGRMIFRVRYGGWGCLSRRAVSVRQRLRAKRARASERDAGFGTIGTLP